RQTSVKIRTSLDLVILFAKSISTYTAKRFLEPATSDCRKVASPIQIPPPTSKWHLAVELTYTSPAISSSERSISKLKSGQVFNHTLFPPGEAPLVSPMFFTNS